MVVHGQELPANRAPPVVRRTVQWLRIILHFGTLRHAERCFLRFGIDLLFINPLALDSSSTKVVPYHCPIVFSRAAVV